MKILLPFVGDSVGGSHRSIIELYIELEKMKHTPIFVLHKIGPFSNLLDDLNIKYEYIYIKYLAGESPNPFKIAFGIIFNFIKISWFIRKNTIDIVHGNDLRINLTWSLPTRLSSASYLWHQRSFMSSSKLWNISSKLADHFVTISNYVHYSLPKNVPKSKKTLVLNPFNTNDIYNRNLSREWVNSLYNIPKNSILFGYIGRLVDWKNLDFLIKCFAEYNKKRDIQFHLIIVGMGNNEYVDNLKQLIFKLRVENIITFAGFNVEPNRIISSFDLLVAPSNKEPFGRTLVEAMIQKTPVLAARGGGHSEIIENEVTGVLYEHNNIDNFITQCDKYINNSKFMHRIINNASYSVNLKYSSRKHAESIIKIYHQLISI